jgi:hypothetical protein
MLGRYDNFPENIHVIMSFSSIFTDQKLQRKIMQTFREVNHKSFSFEEIGIPIMRGCTVIFEIGMAERKSFNYVNDEETKRVLSVLKKQSFRVMDFFIAVRYYKSDAQKKTPLRFDYYMIRFVFNGNNYVELQVFHERGPRHIAPADIVQSIEGWINGPLTKKVLRRIEPPS